MGPGLLPSINHAAGRTAQWAAVALGFSIPISTALDNMLLAVVLAGWLASGSWRIKWDTVRGNHVALAVLTLYGLLLAGTLYGTPAPGDVRTALSKYLDLLWIPVLAWLFREAAMRRRALYAIAASLTLVLLTSCLLKAGIISQAPFFRGDAITHVVMKTRQTHGLMMALGAYLFILLALAATSRRMRILWSTLALVAVANGTLVVPGATGYLVLGTLALYLGAVWKGWRGIAAAAAASAVAVSILMTLPGPFADRVRLIRDEIAQWQPGVADAHSSTGQRLEFYRVSLALVKDRPLLGHGTGSFTGAYAEKLKGQPTMLTRNPHNEYLHWMVQLGVVGFAALLFLFWTHWRNASRLATPLERHLARGLLLAMIVGCLFNSWLMDHTEGLLYAWLTGVLFAGLESPRKGESPLTDAT